MVDKFYKEETMEKNSKETCVIYISNMCYREVEFRGTRCRDRWFPIAINSTIVAGVPMRVWKGKTIDRIDNQTIIHKGEANLQEELARMTRENQEHTEPSVSTHGPLLAPQPPCPKCGNEREHPLVWLNDPIKAMSLRHYQRRTPADYTPSTFDLGIPLSPERRIPTAISSPTYNDEQVCLGDSEGQCTSMHPIVDIHSTECSRRKIMVDTMVKMKYPKSQKAIEELYEFNAQCS
ncbi:hypothetical protein Cgig2_003054 [Carnegiea gigantea]|uniref:Uncharacterized protein n=1 Tax=Carnegiea gigantea TaxID=171969 RepID=A0A9Q1JTA4_9CARY|nr:hypothetical protein Cgig2_003054 [Carnegiea gigantea]